MKKYIVVGIILAIANDVAAQTTEQTDSLQQRVRSYVARNFSDIRTFNFSWQASPAHTYYIKNDGKTLEKGEMQSSNNIKFNTTIPVYLSQKLSLYAIAQADFYTCDLKQHEGEYWLKQQDADSDNRQYYRGTLNGMWRTSLFGKPLLVNANISIDGYNQGVEQVLGTIAAISVLKRNRHTSISAGLAFVWPFNNIPVMPVLTYWHQFTPKLSIDISMPRQFYLRYQPNRNSRLSVGSTLQSDQYYFKSQGETRYFSETSLNTELLYEYIVSQHFYFFGRAGVSTPITGGIYKANRKEFEGIELDYHRRTEPFFTVGCSYNIFK